MTDDELKKQKEKDEEVAWYSALVHAWVATRMELDKSILTLSAGAVGLLVTLLINFGVNTQCELLLYIVSLVLFLIAISCALAIFFYNSVLIGNLCKKDYKENRLLKRLDRALILSFAAGIFSTVALAFITVWWKRN